jgi:hypothetical protein
MDWDGEFLQDNDSIERIISNPNSVIIMAPRITNVRVELLRDPTQQGPLRKRFLYRWMNLYDAANGPETYERLFANISDDVLSYPPDTQELSKLNTSNLWRHFEMLGMRLWGFKNVFASMVITDPGTGKKAGFVRQIFPSKGTIFQFRNNSEFWEDAPELLFDGLMSSTDKRLPTVQVFLRQDTTTEEFETDIQKEVIDVRPAPSSMSPAPASGWPWWLILLVVAAGCMVLALFVVFVFKASAQQTGGPGVDGPVAQRPGGPGVDGPGVDGPVAQRPGGPGVDVPGVDGPVAQRPGGPGVDVPGVDVPGAVPETDGPGLELTMM